MSRTSAQHITFRVTARVAVAPRGSVSIGRIIEAFRVDPLARRPRI